MFTYVGRSKFQLTPPIRGYPAVETNAVLWQDNPRGGGQRRHFFVRPSTQRARYHLRIIVGDVITTNRDSVGRQEVLSAARLMGIEVGDSHWAEVDRITD